MPFYLAATTGPNGFALQNATPTILQWVCPNDGRIYSVNVATKIVVGSAMTGGTVGLQVADVTGAVDTGPTVFNAKASAGTFHFADNPTDFTVCMSGGATLSLVQLAALSAGAATVYANIYVADYQTVSP